MISMQDSKFRKPRIWSNNELKKFTKFFNGKVLNVSGWQDKDKEGSTYYEKYFFNSKEYYISNFEKNMRGYQGNLKNEFYLDLTNSKLENKENYFDVVFNHTTLEHIFEIDLAFKNLSKLTKDILIIVVPFLQEEHGDYGDFWRFTPQSILKLYEKNNIMLSYLNYNDDKKESIYIFAIGSKILSTHNKLSKIYGNKVKNIGNKLIGKKIITNSYIKKIILFFKSKYGF